MPPTIIRYTPVQLEHLRSSPLVHKPDGLPAIEQWMDPPVEQTNGRRPRSGVLREGETPTNGEGRNDRPLLINAGMGHFGRRPSQQPEDTVLGPPKLSFTSASRTAKTAESNDKRTNTNQEGEGALGERFASRDRWTRDRDTDRTRDKLGFANGRRTAREDGEGWTNSKARKSLGQEDFDRVQRNGDRERDKPTKDNDTENGEVGSRRGGTGRDRFEPRWGRRDESGVKEGEGNKTRTTGQGWRDREKERDQGKDREWTRGGARIEEDPEWMDTPIVTEKKQAHTQEDFQRWKERMKAKETPIEEKEPVVESPLSAREPTGSIAGISTAMASKPATPLALEGGLDKLFGAWGKEKAVDFSNAESTAPVKTTKTKPKSSRFAGLFAPTEEQPKLVQQPPAPASPEPTLNGNNEDKEGFQRILQMLGGTSISGPPSSQQESAPPNGIRQGGLRPDVAQQQPIEERPDSIPPLRQQMPRSREERNAFVESVLASRPSQSIFSPEIESGPEQYRTSRPESNRPGDDFPLQPPPRNSSAQDAHNLQALLSGRASQGQAVDNNRDFLLALMQNRATPPQLQNQNLPRQPLDMQNMAPFMETNTQRMQSQPKGRGMARGAYENGPHMFADMDVARREAERRELGLRELREASIREANMRDAGLRDAGMPQPEALRKNSQRLPPGIFPDDPSITSLQRRNTSDNMPRQMTNMGIPQQPVNELPPYMRNQGMPPTPQERNIAPPPGFGPSGMRQPPGFGGPQGGPQPQMGPLSAGNTPFGHPGMHPPRGLASMGFPGQGQGQIPPPGPPQGYFPPPGFPPMGMQRGEDPRMMMGRPEFDPFGGPNQPGLQRPGGRPPGMFNMQ